MKNAIHVDHKSADNIIFKVAGSEIPETLYHFFCAIDVGFASYAAYAHFENTAVTSKIQLASLANYS